MEKSISRYRKVGTVEALQWDPSSPEALDWLAENGARYKVLGDGRLAVGTLESGEKLDHHAGPPGAWVLRGVAGEFYICDDAIFRQTYEPDR